MTPDEPQPATPRRSRRIAAFAIAAVLVAAAVAAGAIALHDDEPLTTISEVRVIQESDDDSTVRVAPGQRVEIRLDENPTTGYLWKAHMVAAPTVLDTIDDDWQVDDGCEDGMTGCGGVHTWRYEAADKPGTTPVSFDLHSRTPGEVVEQFAVTVEVR